MAKSASLPVWANPPSGSFTGSCSENIHFQDRLLPRCTSDEENSGSTRIGDSTGASQIDVPECNSPSSVPVLGQPSSWTKEMSRALGDYYKRSEPRIGGYLKRLEGEWLSKYPNLPQTGRTLACQAKRNLAGDGVLQVTDNRDLDLVNDAPQGASRRRRVQGVIWNLQRDNILMELYRHGKWVCRAVVSGLECYNARP